MARRTRRPAADTPPAESPEPQPAPVADQTGVELLEDRTRAIAGGSTGRRIGASVPGAIAGMFLVVALALGAGGEPAFEPAGAGHDGPTSGDVAGNDGSETGDGIEAGDDANDAQDVNDDGASDESPVVKDEGAAGDEGPDGESADGDNPDSDSPDGGTPEGQTPDAPSDTADEPVSMELGLALDGYAVVVEWSACSFDSVKAYKIVRSTDEAVTWPLGAGDSLVAVIDDLTKTRIVDSSVSHGRTYFYRVFAVRSIEGGYVVVCKSAAKSIKTPAAPEPQPEPQPEPGAFALDAFLVEGHPALKWTSCGDVTFTKFKIVRSADSTVTWPTGENDVLIGALGPDGHTFWDKEAPGGTKLFYRVFCVLSTEAGYVVKAASNVDSVTTPAYEPPPDPISLGFEANLTGEGVVLHWQDCTSDAFSFYKVVRSMNENPSYLPYTDGTQVIGVIENHSVTGLTDGDVTSGQTWYYRVQAIGYWNGQKVVLGQTAVIAVTIP